MKRTSKKLWIVAVSVLLTALMFLAMPLSVMAKTAAVRPMEMLVLSSSNVEISSENGAYDKENLTYAMEFYADGAGFSSFAFGFRMPDFVQVQDVVLGDELNNLDNATFTWHERDGLVNTAYSSADNISGVRMFTVYFTVTDYTPAYFAVECAQADFVDVNYNVAMVQPQLGYVQIGEVSFTKMGDVDANGVVDLADLLIIQRSMVNLDYPLNEQQVAVADINKDGAVTILDCQYIQNYLVGRIDSLENIGGEIAPSLYTLTVEVKNQDGMTMYYVEHFVEKGVQYAEILLPICEMLDAQYSITGVPYATSDVYGMIDGSMDPYKLVVIGNDHLFVMAETETMDTEKTVVYTYADEMDQNGMVMVLDYYFYSDGTAQFKMVMLKEGKPVDEAEQWVNWKQDGDYIIIYIPEIGPQTMFVVNKDGSLSAYEGGGNGGTEPKPDQPSDDYIVGSRWSIEVGLTVGADFKELEEKLCGKTFTLIFAKSGEVVVEITSDMINYEGVNLNEVGEYEVEINYFVNGCSGTIWVDVYVIEDKGDVEQLGTYDFPEGEEMMGVSTLTLYADGTVQLGSVYVTEYQWYADDVIILSLYGGDFLIALDDAAMTAYFYKPTENLIGRYVYEMGGGEMFFEVYGDYVGAGDYVTVYGVEAPGYQMSLTTRAYLDLENRVLRHAATPCNMIIDDSNKLVENHSKVHRVEAPTCDQSGFEYWECTECGREFDHVSIAPLGHQYDDEGNCVNCGQSGKEDGALEMRKAQALTEMKTTWEMLWQQYGDALYQFESMYEKYEQAICEAAYEYVVDEYLNYFRSMVEEVHNKLGGMSRPTGVTGWHYYNEVPTWVMEGADLEQYLNDYVRGNTLVLELSDGTFIPVLIEDFMIRVEGGFGEAGSSCWIYIHVATGEFSYECDLVVHVQPNMGDVASTTYSYTGVFNGWGPITVYENGMLEIFGQFYSYMMIGGDENVTVIRFHGNSFYGESVLALDRNTLEASFYQPEGNVVGRYTLREGDNEYIYTLYGEMAVSGDFVVVVQRRFGDGTGNYKQEDQYTTVLYCNFEESFINSVEHGMLSFDAEGNLYRIGFVEPDYPEDPNKDFEKYQDKIKDDLKMLWSEIDQGGYEVSDEQRERFYNIMDRVYTATEIWQLDELYEEARALCNEIKGIVEIDYYRIEGMPYRVVVGITMEEFYQMLNRVKVTLYYTDGSFEEHYLTVDNFDLSRIDLNKVGECEYSYQFVLSNGEEHSSYNWLTVMENKAENAKLMGTYNYVAREDGAENEWQRISLYDNGYALISDGSYMEFIEYTLDGNVLMYSDYGAWLLFEILDDKSITAYCAADHVTYSYGEPEWGMTVDVNVFAHGDMYFAYLLGTEIYGDEVEKIELTCNVYYNADQSKIRIPALDDMWFAISEDGALSPTECDEHVFNEKGYCEYCGEKANGNGGYVEIDKCDHMLGADGCCVYCGLYVVNNDFAVENLYGKV